MIGKCPKCGLNRKLFVCRHITDLRCLELFHRCIWCANRSSLVIIAEAQEATDVYKEGMEDRSSHSG